jgi:hypothetical protein
MSVKEPLTMFGTYPTLTDVPAKWYLERKRQGVNHLEQIGTRDADDSAIPGILRRVEEEGIEKTS